MNNYAWRIIPPSTMSSNFSWLFSVLQQILVVYQGLVKFDVPIMIFQKKKISRKLCVWKRLQDPKLSTLGNVRPFQRHVTAPPSHAWPAQGGAAALPCCCALNKTKPSSWKQSLESHSGPLASLMRMFKTCWRFVQAEPVGYISVGVAAAAPVMVWSCKISNSPLQLCSHPPGLLRAWDSSSFTL